MTARPDDDTPETAAADHPLDNMAWHALNGPHRDLAETGVGAARRYRRVVAPFSAVDRLDDEGWGALADLVGPGGVAILFRAEVDRKGDNRRFAGAGPRRNRFCATLVR